MARKKRGVPGINSSSTADIAFMLLIFFLITTSMDTDRGLARRLPPPPENKDQKDDDIIVKERNILQVRLNKDNQLMCGTDYIDVKQLKEKAKEFIANPYDDENLPEKHRKNIPLLGDCMITENHVISVQNDVGTSYQAYIDVQNELVAAYNELRNELGKAKFGKLYNECNEDEQKAIREYYPQKISELNTSSLPDLIFTMLFFFMIVTTMREVTLKVQFQVPQGTELEKLEKKSLVSFIYIGKPLPEFQKKMGAESRIQLNDKFAEVSEVQDYIYQERENMKEEDQPFMTVSLKVDKDTKMGIVQDVKQALRQAYALKINYSATQRQ